MNLSNTQINATVTMGKLSDKNVTKFCEYYRCSILPTERVAKYRTVYPTSQVDSEETYNFDERVFNIQITESMLDDLVNKFGEMIIESEVRNTDPRLMKMYGEYKTLYNLLR